MNDRYLFRAKQSDNRGWAEGFLYPGICLDKGKWIITIVDSVFMHSRSFEVDQSTICQCTGLNEIFEKDIVQRTDIHKVGEPSIGIIEYDVENTAFVIHWIDKEKYSSMYPWKDKIKVIGNIFDNPELMEQEG